MQKESYEEAYKRLYEQESRSFDMMIKQHEEEKKLKSYNYKRKHNSMELIHPDQSTKFTKVSHIPFNNTTQQYKSNVQEVNVYGKERAHSQQLLSDSYNSSNKENSWYYTNDTPLANGSIGITFTVEENEAFDIACARESMEDEMIENLKRLTREYKESIVEQYTEVQVEEYAREFYESSEVYIKHQLDCEYYGEHSEDEIYKALKERGYKSDKKLSATQINGINFAMKKFITGKGCIIAHEMGLGKTLLALAIERIVTQSNSKRTLVICPPGLAESWKSECFEYFGTTIKILFYEGYKKPWYSYGGKHGTIGAKHSTIITEYDINLHDIVLTHYQALTKKWSDIVRKPVRAEIRQIQSTTHESYGLAKSEIYKEKLATEFPLLDWNLFYTYKGNTRPINVRTLRDGCSIPAVGAILGHEWGMIIVDEAHKMGNPESLLSEVCYAMMADFKLALTGTPTPNYTSELWSIFRFIEVPDLQGHKEFSITTGMLAKELIRETKRNVSYGESETFDTTIDISNATKKLREKYDSGLYPMNTYEINFKKILDMMEKWMQKITKNTLARETKPIEELNEETNRYITQGWKLINYSSGSIPPAYEKVIKIDPYVALVRVHECIKNAKREESRQHANTKNENFFMTETVSYLRMLVSHPTSLSEDVYERYCNMDDVKLLLELESQKFLELIKYYNEEVKPLDQKMIIFAQFKCTTRYVYKRLEEFGVSSIYMDGDVDKKSKNRICVTFSNSSVTKAMCTTHCIGLGYNIPGANHVIFWDQWWNLPEDEQGYSRTLRPGQRYDVKVLRLLYKDTIEEAIHKIAQNKDKLNTGISLKHKQLLNF